MRPKSGSRDPLLWLSSFRDHFVNNRTKIRSVAEWLSVKCACTLLHSYRPCSSANFCFLAVVIAMLSHCFFLPLLALHLTLPMVWNWTRVKKTTSRTRPLVPISISATFSTSQNRPVSSVLSGNVQAAPAPPVPQGRCAASKILSLALRAPLDVL